MKNNTQIAFIEQSFRYFPGKFVTVFLYPKLIC